MEGRNRNEEERESEGSMSCQGSEWMMKRQIAVRQTRMEGGEGTEAGEGEEFRHERPGWERC